MKNFPQRRDWPRAQEQPKACAWMRLVQASWGLAAANTRMDEDGGMVIGAAKRCDDQKGRRARGLCS